MEPTADSIALAKRKVRCCVVGGGPAGLMAGYLLARAGVEVLVLEKHGDFLRDFRGDTIHPSTLELMAEIGILEEFLALPHQKMRTLSAVSQGVATRIADFSRLPTRCRFIAIMPQWDFLDFIAAKARLLPNFGLLMRAEATGLLWNAETVAGVRVRTPEGELEVSADLVIGADGRHSRVRSSAGLVARDFGAPIDVLWMRLPKTPVDTEQALGYFGPGKFMILIDRHDYFQAGYVIPKGGLDALKARGIEGLRTEMAALAPAAAESVAELKDWSQVNLLTVTIDRLPRWHKPGLLCIGDSAHAMSPAGGVGINFAIQDAVATANLLAASLRLGPVGEELLAKVQRRRQWPVAIMQRLQLGVHHRMMALSGAGPDRQVLPLWLFRAVPFVRHLIGRLVGIGPRPEHVAAAPLG